MARQVVERHTQYLVLVLHLRHYIRTEEQILSIMNVVLFPDV